MSSIYFDSAAHQKKKWSHDEYDQTQTRAEAKIFNDAMDAIDDGFQLVAGVGYFQYPDAAAADQGATGDSDTIKYAVDTIGSDRGTIYLRHNSGDAATIYTLTTAESIPKEIKVIAENGAIIDGAGTLTLASPNQIKCERQKIFGSSITVEFINGSTVYPEWRGNDSVAINFVANSLTSNDGTVDLDAVSYEITSTIALPKGINLKGQHTPNQMSPGDVFDGHGTVFNRTADVPTLTLTGTNRVSNRGGKQLIYGISFENALNVSAEATIDAIYCDTVFIEKCSFFNQKASTTVGHTIDTEECWDWTVQDNVYKYYGNSGETKHCLNYYNGEDDSCNYMTIKNNIFGEGIGKAIYSDGSGAGGVRNFFFTITGNKFECGQDTANDYISGQISHADISGNYFVTGDTRFLELDSNCGNWRIFGNTFMSIGDTPTEAINIDGSQSIRITDNMFTGIGAATTRWIHLDGAGGGELRGVTIVNNNFYETVLQTTPIAAFTGTIHPSVIIKDNGSYQNETVTTDAKALMVWPGYSYLNSDDNKVDSTLGDGLKAGDIKTIVMINADNSSIVTIAHHVTSDDEEATFNAVGETWIGLWNGTKWVDLYATCTFV
jgi:hypothetical protein